jgi:hypothetical protein
MYHDIFNKIYYREYYPVNFLTDDRTGSDLEIIKKSCFLVVKDLNDNPTSYFLALKPESLWLSKNSSGKVVDAYGKIGNDIASYSYAYSEIEKIKAAFLINSLSVENVIRSRYPSGYNFSSEGDITEVKVNVGGSEITFSDVYIYDMNIKTRLRIAAPNVPTTTTYEGFSKWL